MSKKMKKCGEILCIGTDGKRYTIVEYAWMIDCTTITDTEPQWTEGQMFFQLQQGTPVNVLNDAQFEIVSTGTIVTRL